MALLGAASPERLISRVRPPPANRLKLSTGAAEITQASLLEAPDCIDKARMVSSAATRVRPPGITIQPFGVQAAKTRRETGRAANFPFSNTGATPKGETSCTTRVAPR